MITRRRRGFTLIELLVVIAIIAILAAMLFPVFARARESARKIQCLANMKNIALAINMYLTDYDRFPPSEHRQEVLDFIYTQPGGANECRIGQAGERVQWMANLANPYIRWPVILDEYVRNRDVWRCPSAKVEAAASFIVPMSNWLGYLDATRDQWGDAYATGPCYHMTFPPGWGGSVTDSILQQMNAGFGQRWADSSGGTGAFVQTVTPGEENFYDVKTAALQNFSGVPVAADGALACSWLSIANVAYPEVCCAECSGIQAASWGWPNYDCPNGSWCPDCFEIHATPIWANSPDMKRNSTRHLGGNNVAFADGHAQWFVAGTFLAMSDKSEIEYVGAICGEYTSFEGHQRNCGVDPGDVFLYTREQDWWGR